MDNYAELIRAGRSLSLSSLPMKRKPKKTRIPSNDSNVKTELIMAGCFLSLSPPSEDKLEIFLRWAASIQTENPSRKPKTKRSLEEQSVDKGEGNHQWYTKLLSQSDGNGSSRLLLPIEYVRKQVFPFMDQDSCMACQSVAGLRVKIKDADTETEHKLTLKQWKTDSFLLTSSWRKEFVKRRSLKNGDTVDFFWNSQIKSFFFRKTPMPNH